jgi:adenylosuccinate synthase
MCRPFPTELLDNTGETLRSKGGEFGTTTGRPRRCGWIDIPQLRYASMVNGFHNLNLTKLDVLTGFEEIKVCVEYIHENECIEGMPASLKTYAEVRPMYASLPGWNEDISKCRRFEDLPKNAQAYVIRIEELAGVHIRWIGVGAGREDIIDRS